MTVLQQTVRCTDTYLRYSSAVPVANTSEIMLESISLSLRKKQVDVMTCMLQQGTKSFFPRQNEPFYSQYFITGTVATFHTQFMVIFARHSAILIIR